MRHIDTLLATPDLWQALAGEERDILLYGMGNGADKLLAVCESRGIPVRGVFASDGFVRGHSFHGMRVLSFSEVTARYPANSCVVLLACGSSRPEVLSLFDRVADRYPLYVPDLPVCGDTLFDADFLRAHQEDFARVRALLADGASRTLFDLVLECKYHADYKTLRAAVSAVQPWDLIAPRRITAMADFGAYNGDSAREALQISPTLRFILAAEPDARNFKKLVLWHRSVQNCEIECHGVAVCDRCGEAAFDASGNRNAGLCTGRESKTVTTATPDALLGGRFVDYMKFDVEGAEAAALRGSAETLKAHRPTLRVAAYHRPEDLFALLLQLHALCPDYRFYLTRADGCPAWDLDLIALSERD